MSQYTHSSEIDVMYNDNWITLGNNTYFGQLLIPHKDTKQQIIIYYLIIID